MTTKHGTGPMSLISSSNPLSTPPRGRSKRNSTIWSGLVTLSLKSMVKAFLENYQKIRNTLACIWRSFESVEYMCILVAAGVIMGTHLVEPYLSLTSFSTISWEKLTSSLPIVYQDLTIAQQALLIDITKSAFNLVSEERFYECLYWCFVNISLFANNL